MTKNSGFTLLEALLSLSVSSLVLVSLQFMLPSLHRFSQVDTGTTFKTAVRQIEDQKYLLKNVEPNKLELSSYESKKMTLEVKNSKLQLSGESTGQIILMHDVSTLVIEDRTNYLNLTITTNKSKKLSTILRLERKKQYETE